MKTVISGIPFEVVEREPNTRDDGNMGKADIKCQLITIDKSMGQAMKESTLIHEWVHMVLEVQGIDHGEGIVCAITNELYREGFRVKVTK